jgi:transmembrane sensor
MNEWNQKIFEELISDNQFIRWAKGEDFSMEEHWTSWEMNHPECVIEFQEAVRMVKTLNFRGTVVSSGDIAYSWTKTSEKIKQNESVSRFRYFLSQATKVAAVLLLPFMVVSGWLLYNQHNLTQKYSNLLENKQEQNLTVVAPVCARIVVDLPDGTKVWLNSGSELTYPIVFNTIERRVHLTGEAYFKVKKSETPFFVSNLGPEIKVYGTEFNVNSYTNEDLVTVALAEGKISLNMDGKEEFITPGQVSFFDKKNKNVTIENTDIVTYSSWREGKYIFRDTPLSSILRILQRQYNVLIVLDNPQLSNYRYKLTIGNESLEQILQLLSISAPIKYNYKRKELNPDGTYVPDNIEISADNTRIIKN